MKTLEVNNIFAGYGKSEILHGVSISIEKKEAITIIGPNGAGKSTLLKAIMGYISIFKGDIYWGGDNITHLEPHDKDQGRAYRTYAGISMENIPSEGTFSNFRDRLGESLYNEIFHVLVSIFHQLEMISFKILTHDGTLYPTWARYKGCTYFSAECHYITVKNIIAKGRNRILYRLNNLSKKDHLQIS